jgi:hypothetical protein
MGNPISLPPTPNELEMMQQIIFRHSISFTAFNGLVYSFFNQLPAALSSYPKTSQAVIESLGSGTLEDKVFMIISPDKVNGDLRFDPEIRERSITRGDKETFGLSSYSFGLLVGLATLYPDCTFHFYKACKYNGGGMKSTVVFSIQLGSHSVYFGDLSEAHP